MANNSKQVSITGTGGPVTSAWAAIDLADFAHGVGLILTYQGSAAGVVNVQVTGDPVGQPVVNANNHDLMNNLTASANGNLVFPVTAVRLQSAGLTGTVVLSIVQAKG